MGKIILPDSVEAQLMKRAVSSAAPGLSPESRFVETKKQFSKFKHDHFAQEGFDKARALNRSDNGRSIADEQAKMGKAMSSADFEKRLKVLNPNILVEPAIGNSNILGVYVLGNFGTLPNGEPLRKRHLCRMDRGWMTEGDVHKFKMVKRLVQTHPPVYEDIPELDASSIRRGWRSILMVLMKAGVLTKAQVDKAFGLPSWDSYYWQAQTQ